MTREWVRRPPGAALALAACAALLGAGCADSPPPPPTASSVLLITIDTLRADALGFAGERRAQTPVLDRLAARGRVFTNAQAHSVTTLPSHASILTGRYPYEHGVRKNGGYVLDATIPTLATMLQERGFATAAVVGAFPLAARFGLDRGFGLYDDELAGAASARGLYAERSGRQVVERALSWWQAQAGQRRFLWVHLFEPHAPYAPPARYAVPEAPYLGEVAAADAYLAPLLEPLEHSAAGDTLVVFTSDHGESLGEHGELTHGLFAYQATLAVPLVVAGPGVEPGRDRRLARHVDLLPTVLAAVGLRPPPELPGRSLLEPPASHPEDSYFESLSSHLEFGWAPLRGVVRGSLKLIALPVPELYDLATDPAELRNLHAERRDEARALARLLPAETPWPPAPRDAPPAELERLRALGYLSGGSPGRRRYTDADDPKRLVALDRKALRMTDLLAAGELDAAIRLGREILAERPSMSVIYLHLAAAQIDRGDLAGAIATLEEARRRGAAGRAILRQLGLALASAGRAREAVEVLRPLTADSRDVEAHNNLAIALSYLGQLAEARALLLTARELEPDHARTHESLAYVALRAERAEEAREHARRAVELDPGLADAWNNLGVALYRLDREGQAISAWRRYLELAPGDLAALFNLGVLEAQSGDAPAARRSLERYLEAATGAEHQERRRQARELLVRLARAPAAAPTQ